MAVIRSVKRACALKIIFEITKTETYLEHVLDGFSIATKAEEMKNVNCSICGAPLWSIKRNDGELVDYACLNGHVFTYQDKHKT